jgi:hypothetical protein
MRASIGPETRVTIQNPEGIQHARTYAAATTRRDKTRERLSVMECLTMRFSDAGLRRRETKLLYLNHRPSPWLTDDVPRDRSNRLLDVRWSRPT